MLNATPFAATNKATLDALMSLTATAFDGVQQLAALNLQVIKTSLDETAEASLALLSAKDPQALLALQTELLQPSAEKATAYGRQVVDILTQTKAEFERIATEQVSGIQKSIMSLVGAATKNGPDGSGSGVALFQSAMAAANNAFDGFQKATRQATEAAEANYNAVAGSMVKSAGKAKRA